MSVDLGQTSCTGDLCCAGGVGCYQKAIVLNADGHAKHPLQGSKSCEKHKRLKPTFPVSSHNGAIAKRCSLVGLEIGTAADVKPSKHANRHAAAHKRPVRAIMLNGSRKSDGVRIAWMRLRYHGELCANVCAVSLQYVRAILKHSETGPSGLGPPIVYGSHVQSQGPT